MRNFPRYEKDEEHFSAPAYTVKDKAYRGVAWYVLGWEVEYGPTEWWDDDAEEMVYDEEPGDVRTGRVVAVMIGDDRKFVFDEEDLEPITREDYCSECGQIGCGHDGYDRSVEA